MSFRRKDGANSDGGAFPGSGHDSRRGSGTAEVSGLTPKRERLSPASSRAREAVLYARVSSKDQEREGFSIPAQLRLLRDYATNRGLVIAQEFTDVETAKASGR